MIRAEIWNYNNTLTIANSHIQWQSICPSVSIVGHVNIGIEFYTVRNLSCHKSVCICTLKWEQLKSWSLINCIVELMYSQATSGPYGLSVATDLVIFSHLLLQDFLFVSTMFPFPQDFFPPLLEGITFSFERSFLTHFCRFFCVVSKNNFEEMEFKRTNLVKMKLEFLEEMVFFF